MSRGNFYFVIFVKKWKKICCSLGAATFNISALGITVKTVTLGKVLSGAS
jgi:hypothetical protein